MSLRLDGLQELRDALGKLPAELQAEAAQIVQDHAHALQSETRAAYPQVTGNLRRGVSVNLNRSTTGVQAIVASRARHASLFERGTRARQTHTGANRGTMPVAPESARMIPKAIRVRRSMIAAIVALVRAAGFEVTVS